MLGGSKFIRLRMNNDVAFSGLKQFLADRGSGPAMNVVCLEAGELRGTSALRKFAETNAKVAAVLCAPDTQASLEEFIRIRLNDSEIDISDDAFAVLLERLGQDRGMTTRELEKLEAYAAQGEAPYKIDVSDVSAVIGDTTEAEIDTIIDATFSGNVLVLGPALERAAAAEINPITILRLSQMQADRIGRRLAGQKSGMNYYQEEWLKRNISRWNTALAIRAKSLLYETELACKQTGVPAREVCERALLSLASGLRR